MATRSEMLALRKVERVTVKMWAVMPCGIPGYDMTAGAFAAMIQEYAKRGAFGAVEHYLSKAGDAGMLHRIERATGYGI